VVTAKLNDTEFKALRKKWMELSGVVDSQSSGGKLMKIVLLKNIFPKLFFCVYKRNCLEADAITGFSKSQDLFVKIH